MNPMREISISAGRVALVDDEDYDLVSGYKWIWVWSNKKDGGGYARTWLKLGRIGNKRGVRRKRTCVSMHELIGKEKGLDHADGDGLNNQKYNLRKATRSQQNINRSAPVGKASIHKGVTRWKHLWRARIVLNYKHILIGYFKDEVDAATAYNFKAYELFGEFARMNTPQV